MTIELDRDSRISSRKSRSMSKGLHVAIAFTGTQAEN